MSSYTVILWGATTEPLGKSISTSRSRSLMITCTAMLLTSKHQGNTSTNSELRWGHRFITRHCTSIAGIEDGFSRISVQRNKLQVKALHSLKSWMMAVMKIICRARLLLHSKFRVQSVGRSFAFLFCRCCCFLPFVVLWCVMHGLPLVNPSTPVTDQNGISPYNIHTISSRQVIRIKENIN